MTNDPSFDERGIGRFHDVDMMARVGLDAADRGDTPVARMCVILPGVLNRIIELEDERGYRGGEQPDEARPEVG